MIAGYKKNTMEGLPFMLTKYFLFAFLYFSISLTLPSALFSKLGSCI
jgi:hypothetical protein